MKSTQLFKRTDVVHIAADLGPSMSHFSGAGQEAIVMSSYSDQYGGRADGPHDYTLLIDGSETSWYHEHQLTKVRDGTEAEILEIKAAKAALMEQQSQIPWIVENWPRLKAENSIPGASVAALGKLMGITDMWGGRGEGVAWYANADYIVKFLTRVLDTGDIFLVEALCLVHKSMAEDAKV